MSKSRKSSFCPEQLRRISLYAPVRDRSRSRSETSQIINSEEYWKELKGSKRWQDAINRVSLSLKSRRTSSSTARGSLHSDSEDAGHDGPKQPPIHYENTFQLEPKDSQRFPSKKAEDIIKDTFSSNLAEKKYSPEQCKNITTQLTELIRTQVKQELGIHNRFKIVVLVMVGSMKGQGVRCASRCLWYPQFDRFASYSYYNESLFAVGTVYGVYYE